MKNLVSIIMPYFKKNLNTNETIKKSGFAILYILFIVITEVFMFHIQLK